MPRLLPVVGLLLVGAVVTTAAETVSADPPAVCGVSRPRLLAILEPGREYRVVAMNGQPVPQVEGFTAPTLTLDAQEQRVSGTSGINRYGGGYTLADGTLTIAQPFSTMMAGPEAAMQAEQDFLGVIAGPLKLTADPQGVRLTSIKGSLVVAPVPVPVK